MSKRNVRLHSQIRVEFATRGDEPREGLTSNLSETGLFLAADSSYEIGTLVRVKLLLAEPLGLDTVVVHSRKGVAGATGTAQSGMGLRFLNPSTRLAELLARPPAIGIAEAADQPPEARDASVAPAEGEAPQDRAVLAAPGVVDDFIETQLAEMTAEPSEQVEPAEPADLDEPDKPEDPEDEEEPEEPVSEDSEEPGEMSEEPEAAPAVAQQAEVDPVSKVASAPVSGDEPAGENDLELRLAEAEQDRLRLEAMLEDDEREKKMLRRLVAKLEKDGVSKAGDASETPKDEATARDSSSASELSALHAKLKASDAESTRLRERVHSLESALAEQEGAAHEQRAKPLREPARAKVRPLARVALFLIGAVVVGSLAALVLVQLLDSKQPRFETAAAARQTPEPVVVAPSATREVAASVNSLPASQPDETSEPSGVESLSGQPTEEPAMDSGPDESAPDPAEDVESTVEAWARAWSEQRVEDYLGYYSVGFEPADGTALSAWRQQREDRIDRPSWIRVTVTRLTTRFPSPDTALAVFDQSYETATYKDRVKKKLRLVNESGGWKITEELAEDP